MNSKNHTLYLCLAEALDRHGANFIELLKSDRKKLTADAIHQTRVATRKLEACLELINCVGIQHKNLKKELHYVRKLHGPLRNINVELEMLKNNKDEAYSKSFKDYLKKNEKKLGDILQKELDHLPLNKYNKEIQKLVLKLIHKDTPEENEKAMKAMEAQNQKNYSEFKKSKQEFSPTMPQSIHPMRIAAKKLRYQREILKPVMKFNKITMAQLKHLQDTFGKIQNNNVLQKSMEKFLCKHSQKGCKSVIKMENLISREQQDLMNLVSRMKTMRTKA